MNQIDFLFKKITEEDLLDMYEWRISPYISEFLNKPNSYEEHLKWWNNIKNDSSKIYYILSCNKVKTGIVIFSNIDYRNYKLELGGYAIPTKNGYRSYYSYYIESIKHYVFNYMNFNKIYMTIPVFNLNSLMVNLKCGFEIEGILKDWIHFNGGFHDVYLLSVLKSKYITKEAKDYHVTYDFINE